MKAKSKKKVEKPSKARKKPVDSPEVLRKITVDSPCKNTEKDPKGPKKGAVRDDKGQFKAKKSSKVGRPTGYTKTLDTKLVDLGRKGKSVTAMILGLGLKSKSTFYSYIAKHDSFKEAFEQAKLEGEAFWELKLEKADTVNERNKIEFILKNRFRSSYQPDNSGVQVNIDATNGPELSENEIDKKIAKLQKSLGIAVIEYNKDE